jgi:polysaccharide pyruvyl transferase WcaK-like protein
MADELVALSKHPHRLHPVGPHLDPRDAKAITGIAAAVVAMRLHAQIFAHSMSTPVWGITFEKKTTSFLTEIGAPCSPGDATGDRLVAWLELVTR